MNNGIGPEVGGIPSDVLWVVQKIGWPVFPVYEMKRGKCACGRPDCKSPGKHPRSTNGVKDATTDMLRIESWARRFPQSNWAASPDGGVVVDIDPRHGGFESINEWGVSLPTTTNVLTGGGGRHLYFTLPEGVAVTNRTNWLPGVDAKTVGGYVLLPGSNHASGGVYQWQDQLEPVVAPRELIDALGKRANSNLPPTSDLLDGVPEGERDDMVFRACCRWWRQFTHHKDGGLDAVTTRALEMGRNCKPPFSDDEVITKVESAARYAMQDPKFRHTDDGNALLYVEQHAGDMKFTSDSHIWFAWDGHLWKPEAELEAVAKARLTARSLVDYARELESDDQRRAALTHAKNSLSAGRINAMPSLAKTDPRIHVETRTFDSHRHLLNTPTGTVDLRTGGVYPHRREEFHSKTTTIGYDPEASSEEWDQWIRWAMNGRDDLIEFLQRSCGYAISGETSEQAIWLHNGEGANGKSTLIKILSGILGNYAHSADPELLTGGHTTGLADLHGKRLVAVSEIKQGARIDEQRVKMLSGEDDITARHLYRDFFTFRSVSTIFWAMNHLPKIDDDTYGMWRRIFVVPWDMVLPRDQQKKGVADWVIKTHGAAVLKWAVDGAVKWYVDGLQVPTDVQMKTKAYKAREDTFGAFINEYFVKDVGAVAHVRDVKTAYEAWCITEGITGKDKLGATTLIQRLEDRLGVTRRRVTINGEKATVLTGYQVIT